MPRLTPRAARRFTMTGALLASLVGCNALPQVTPTQGPAVPPTVSGETDFTQSLTVDVDPLHGAAFERPMRSVQAINVSGALRVVVDFTKVVHDPSTGRTTVTMQITNAGDSLTYLKCNVSGDRKVIDPAYGFNTTIATSGATQTRDLVFDNPTGGGFSVNLSFTGTLNTKGALPVTSSPATTSPSTAPSATPTPMPTATPAPTTGGTITATASSSNGSLTPNRAIDGDSSTQWANDGYQAPEAWLQLDLGSIKPLSSLSVKMAPQSGGGYYVIEGSSDGQAFQAVTGKLKNSTWSLESKTLNAGTNARYVRLHFFNDASAPETRFSVFEAQVNGAANPASSGSPSPAPTAAPTAAPTSTPTSTTGSLFNTFESYASESDPSDFSNPIDEGYSYSWLANATWRVTTVNGSKQYMHDGLSNTANLSFRRYKGNALGTSNGVLPLKYFSEVEVTPIKSYTYQPTGDQGTQFYYLNPTNYVEIVIKPSYYEVWVANDAQPFTSTGWQRIWYTNLNTQANQTRKIAAEVDTTTHSAKIYLDGQLMTTVTTDKLSTQTHYFALRGTGNIVAHDNLRIEPR